jgi:hypothetical protein
MTCSTCGNPEAVALWEQNGRTACDVCANTISDNGHPEVTPAIARFIATQSALEGWI